MLLNSRWTPSVWGYLALTRAVGRVLTCMGYLRLHDISECQAEYLRAGSACRRCLRNVLGWCVWPPSLLARKEGPPRRQRGTVPLFRAYIPKCPPHGVFHSYGEWFCGESVSRESEINPRLSLFPPRDAVKIVQDGDLIFWKIQRKW